MYDRKCIVSNYILVLNTNRPASVAVFCVLFLFAIYFQSLGSCCCFFPAKIKGHSKWCITKDYTAYKCRSSLDSSLSWPRSYLNLLWTWSEGRSMSSSPIEATENNLIPSYTQSGAVSLHAENRETQKNPLTVWLAISLWRRAFKCNSLRDNGLWNVSWLRLGL